MQCSAVYTIPSVCFWIIFGPALKSGGGERMWEGRWGLLRLFDGGGYCWGDVCVCMCVCVYTCMEIKTCV